MSLYNRKNSGSHGHGDSQWTSYSDLFMGLSVVFLLLYVTASLRTGTTGLQQSLEKEKMVQEMHDLRNQLKAYNSIKKEYLEKEATDDDQAMYKQLMDKLSLLKEEAKTEKDKLREQALENETKEKAVNKYQQMVRNIINANMVSKSRIKKRDNKIEEQDQEILEQDKKITTLDQEVNETKNKITATEAELEHKKTSLKNMLASNAISKKSYEKKVAALNNESEQKLTALEKKQQAAENKLAQAQTELTETAEQLDKTKTQLTDKEKEKIALSRKLNETEKAYQERMAQQAAGYEGKIADSQREKTALARKLNESEKQYQDRLTQQASGFENEKQALAKKLNETEKQYQDRLSQQASGFENEKQELAKKMNETEKQYQDRMNKQAAGFAGKIAESQKVGQDQVAKLKGEFAAQQAKDKQAFEGQMAKEKMSGEEKARREAAFRADSERKAKELEGRLGDMGGKLKDTEGKLAQAKAEMEAKKNIARDMQKAFKAAGINAEVDPETGDVVLDFGGHYFATGSSKLNDKMQSTLEKAFPIYAKALFENSKVSKKLAFVEIIGFASPTWKGKQVDPDSLKPADRKAVDFNLDLSYNRAKAIFNHIFDTDKMNYSYQKEMRPLVKVSGRSFFSESKGNRDVAGGKTDYCGKGGDCQKAQKVIIKFSLDNK